jgi:predicted ATPase
MDYLKINHFKCFEEIDIHINQLTLLAGANGNGKSTVIQALLYLRHTIEHCGESNRRDYSIRKANGLNVSLNGVYGLALGSSSFVLNQNYNGTILSIGLFNEIEELTIDYEVDNENAQLWLTPWEVHKTNKTHFPILKHEFYYLNAERVGPRINQSLQFWDYPNAGWQGESTAQLIGMENGYYKIEDIRRFETTKTNYLIDQVNYWLGFIMKGVKVKVETNAKTLTSQILLENAYTVSEPTLATNLGFGISYILPIIATGLIAQKGSYFLVENPEAHLHPSAQSKIGRFLAMVAKAGVHVIVETHSDHIINGLQIAVAKKDIDCDLVTINYFNHTEDSIQPEVQPISMNQKGELSDWPSGFFDQTQLDFAELFKLRKQ